LVPLIYKGQELESKLRGDLFIANALVVELKSVNNIHPIFEAQLLTYMSLLNAKIDLLIKFNVRNTF
jgi:GxxExxY protein